MSIKKTILTGLAGLVIAGTPILSANAEEPVKFMPPSKTYLNSDGTFNKSLLFQELDKQTKKHSSHKSLDVGVILDPFTPKDTTITSELDKYNHSLEAIQNRKKIVDQNQEISKIDTITYDAENFKCTHFSIASQLESAGYLREIDAQSTTNEFYDTLVTPNRFNVPCYRAGIATPNFGHSIIAFMTGNDVTDLNSWYFIEPQNDVPVKFGDYNFPTDTYWLGIEQPTFNYNGVDTVTSRPRLVAFTFTNGIVDDSVWVNPEEDIIRTRPILTSVEENYGETIPQKFTLKQNYPNPFNPTTTIIYALPKTSNVNLEIYNIQGQKLETLVDEQKSAGIHEIEWNTEGKYSSGIYFYKIQTEQGSRFKKMVLLK